MTRRCILHFGMHKTGSSSIQQSLAKAASGVSWVYLRADEANASLALQTMFGACPENRAQNVKRGLGADEIMRNKRKYFERMEAKMAASADKDLLLSAEGLCVMREDEIQGLADWLGNFVDEIVPVGYVRSPKAYIESSFQQRVKNGGLSSFYPYVQYPGYRKRFEKLEAVFGRDKIQYWLFDPRAFSAGCVVRDFASRFGITLSERQVVRVNDGLSREALALLYAYRKYGGAETIGPKAMRENNLLIKKLRDLKGSKVRFSPDIIRPILESNSADVEWMEERLGRRFDEDMETRTALDIANESDLLKFDEAALTIVRQWTKSENDPPVTTPQQAADLVSKLVVAATKPKLRSIFKLRFLSRNKP